MGTLRISNVALSGQTLAPESFARMDTHGPMAHWTSHLHKQLVGDTPASNHRILRGGPSLQQILDV